MKRTLLISAVCLSLWGCPFVSLPPAARVGLAVGAASAPLAHCPTNPRQVAAILNARLALDFHYRYGDHPMGIEQFAVIVAARRNVDLACGIRPLVPSVTPGVVPADPIALEIQARADALALQGAGEPE